MSVYEKKFFMDNIKWDMISGKYVEVAENIAKGDGACYGSSCGLCFLGYKVLLRNRHCSEYREIGNDRTTNPSPMRKANAEKFLLHCKVRNIKGR